jgi:hypothetical protein
MDVFNRKNALVGFATLKYLERRRQRQRTARMLKIALFVTLAVISVGILAGVAAAFLRSNRSEGEPQQLQGYAAAEEESEGAAAGPEATTAEPEPIPAT